MKGLAFLLAVLACASAQYCNLESCVDPFNVRQPHTMCTYTAANKCKKLIASGLTQNEKNRILKLHNDLRQKVARGEETRGSPGPQPAATNMKTLVWDDEIASIAQHWADQCNYGHDKCRNTPKEHIGQNVAYKGTTGDLNSIDVTSMVQSWYDEVRFFDSNLVSSVNLAGGAGGEAIGHYTQMVWASTDKLGCGAVKYVDGVFNKVFLVCNYGPAGNLPRAKVYETGKGVSSNSAPAQRAPSSRPQEQRPQQQEYNPQASAPSTRPQPSNNFQQQQPQQYWPQQQFFRPQSQNNFQQQQPQQYWPQQQFFRPPQQQQQYYNKPQTQSYSYSSYTFNGKKVSKEEFESLSRQYGIWG